MTIGERLKEERVRVGLSQEAFSALVNASKRAQIDWEKGASSPTAAALAALATLASVDVLYVLTGRREGASGSGLSLREAETHLDQIENSLNGAGENLPSTDETQRAALQSVALDPTLPDRIRARADNMLRLGFQDDDAEKRHAAREVRINAVHRRARLFIEDAARKTSWTPSPRILAGLERLITTPGDAPDDIIMWVLSDLITAIQEEASTDRE